MSGEIAESEVGGGAGPAPTGEVVEAACALNAVTFRQVSDQTSVPLVVEGEARATIVADPSNARAMRAAANLQQFIQAATGARLALAREAPLPVLQLGDGPVAAALGLVSSNLPPEGFAIRTVPDRVLIVGNGDGLQWGAVEFLERFVGVRWYFPCPQPDGTDLGQSIPPCRSLVIPPVWLEDAPRFRKREIWPLVADPKRRAGLALAPLQTFLRAGNSWPVRLMVHQPDWSVLPAYVEGRPEVFSLRADGTRNHKMLCYSHPATLACHLEQIQNFLDGRPYTLGISGRAITVSPTDANLACQCPDCAAAVDPAGGEYGSHSRIMVAFVDRLARAIQARWPDEGLTVIFLPYLNYSRAPADVRFPDSVDVQVCGMPGMARYRAAGLRGAEQRNFEAWGRSVRRPIQHWHYACWPADKTSVAYQYPHVIRSFYAANRDRSVGTFINGETNHWPRQHLSLYCWMKCLWNPEFDVDAATDEFCARLFGPAARTMRALVGLQIERWESGAWPSEPLASRPPAEVRAVRSDVDRLEALLSQAFEEVRHDARATARLRYCAGPLEEFFAETRGLLDDSAFRPLLVRRVAENPRVDGRLDDPAWARAVPVSLVRATGRQRGQPATHTTTVRAVWTPEGMTVGFQAAEPQMASLKADGHAHDDANLWWDDNVELLVDVTGTRTADVYQVVVSAAGVTRDARGKDAAWECPGLRVATHRAADTWNAVVFLPFAAFPKGAAPPHGPGRVWLGNVARHRLSAGPREYQRLNTTGFEAADNRVDLAAFRFVE